MGKILAGLAIVLLSRISDQNEDLTKEAIDDIYSLCFWFLFELYLSMKNDLSREFEKARKFALDKINQFEKMRKNKLSMRLGICL